MKLTRNKLFHSGSKSRMSQRKAQRRKGVIRAGQLHIRLQMQMALLQDGQRCVTSWKDSTQNGIQQHRKHLEGGTESFEFAKLSFPCACVDLYGSYPKNPSPAHTSQVNRPGVCSVVVITVWRQWGHKVCPGTSCRTGFTTTCVTEEPHKPIKTIKKNNVPRLSPTWIM